MTHEPLTPERFNAEHNTAGTIGDEQVAWYCALDALILRAYELDIPGDAVVEALQQIAMDRMIETIVEDAVLIIVSE